MESILSPKTQWDVFEKWYNRREHRDEWWYVFDQVGTEYEIVVESGEIGTDELHYKIWQFSLGNEPVDDEAIERGTFMLFSPRNDV